MASNNVKEELSELGKIEKLHGKHPALKEAYEQIQVIRKLLNFQEPGNNDDDKEVAEPWLKSYSKLIAEVEFDEQHPQVKEAWAKYFVLKGLIVSKGENNE